MDLLDADPLERGERVVGRAQRLGVRRELGHDLERGVEPPVHGGGEALQLLGGGRSSAGKCSASVAWVSRQRLAEPRRPRPAKSPPTSSACRSASAKRLRTLASARSQPSVAVRRNCWSIARCRIRSLGRALGGDRRGLQPPVERGDVVGAGPGQHLVDRDVGVGARGDLAEHLHQRVLAERHRGVGLLAAEERRVRLEVELVALEAVERQRPLGRRVREGAQPAAPSPRGRAARRRRASARSRRPPTARRRRGRGGPAARRRSASGSW